MSNVHLIDMVKQDLHSLEDYLNALKKAFKNRGLIDYAKTRLIIVVGDFPTQRYIKGLIRQKDTYGDKSGQLIPEDLKVALSSLVPIVGPLHISLNGQQDLVKQFRFFYESLYKRVVRKDLPKNVKPHVISLMIIVSCGGWILVRDIILEKFKHVESVEVAILINLLDNYTFL